MEKSKEYYEFRKQLKFLKVQKGQGTELISVYLQPGANTNDMSDRLRDEYSQAMNIKSKQTRKNVQAAIDKILQTLKGEHKAPDHGVAIFCGNIDGKIQLWQIVPPEPVGVQIYRCDSSFYLEPFYDMIEPKEKFGLFTMDRREATIAILKGKNITIVSHMTSNVPGKHGKGGQCVAEDSLIQRGDGVIMPIKEITAGDLVLSVDINEYKTKLATCQKTFSRNSHEAYRIRTQYPAFHVDVTPEHYFFTIDDFGLGVKCAEDVKVGDNIIGMRKICFSGKPLKLNVQIPVTRRISNGGLKFLARKRREAGLSQEAAANLIGIRQATISKVECGIGTISLNKIERLLEEYNVGPEEFFKRFVKSSEKFRLPENLNCNLAQFVGYFLGDGCIELNRIRLYDSDKKLLEEYRRIAKKTFSLEGYIRHIKKKKYYQLTIYSKDFVDSLKKIFPEITLGGRELELPSILLGLPEKETAALIRGLFDAEGYVSKDRVAITMISKKLVKQLQMLLLRFGIASSFRIKVSKPNYKVKRSSKQYEVVITDEESLSNFVKNIGFTAQVKNRKLRFKPQRTARINQIPISGRQVMNLARQVGLNTQSFNTANNFFRNEKNMGRKNFRKTILKSFYNRLRELKNKKDPKAEECASIIHLLVKIYDSDLIPVNVLEKTKLQPNGTKFYDLNVPRYECYVVNGLMLHNSQLRFERITEIIAQEWFKKVAEMINQVFKDPKIKGIIAGGPGPTKYSFMNEDYILPEVKHKIKGSIDTSYTDEFGIKEVADRSGEVIKELEIQHEKDLVNKFLKEAVTGGLATYGINEVKEALAIGKVETLLLSEGLEDRLVEELTDLAEKTDAKIEMVSVETPEGEQFRIGFKGIGAFLRYK